MTCNTCNEEIIGDAINVLGFDSWVPHCSEECANIFHESETLEEINKKAKLLKKTREKK